MSETAESETYEYSALAVIAFAILLLGFAVFGGRPANVAVGNGPAWIAGIKQNLATRGYDWIEITIADGIATVGGEAPDVDSRRFGVEAAEKAIERAAPAGFIKILVDGTTMEGGDPSVGAGLADLGVAPPLAACQTAFVTTLEGRTINFDQGSAVIADGNKRLLDALSAVAVRCRAHRIEIAGHTDGSGSASANLALSQNRADAVLRYLIGKGVSSENLTARGYGSARPLDRARTSTAEARNRRIEFIVTAS